MNFRAHLFKVEKEPFVGRSRLHISFNFRYDQVIAKASAVSACVDHRRGERSHARPGLLRSLQQKKGVSTKLHSHRDS